MNLTLKRAVCAGLLAAATLSPLAARADSNHLFQFATIDALLAGAYEGDLTVDALSKKGDFGLGTFNRVDGEMIVLDGVFYKARGDGKVVKALPDEKTPFATVTYFPKGGEVITVPAGANLHDLEVLVESKITNPNVFYAIKVEGTFKAMKTRAIYPQDKPYKPLSEVSKTQSVFEFQDTTGTLVAFRSPGFSKGFNVPGYHWHYLSKDATQGGHVLSLSVEKGGAQLASVWDVDIQLSKDDTFAKADQTKDRSKELKEVESDRR